MAGTLECVEPVLMASDLEGSIAFYARLGFRLVFQDDPASPRYAGVARDGISLHLQWHAKSQWACTHDRPTYRFIVEDVDALYASFRASGAITDRDLSRSPWAVPGETPWGTREFHVLDPDGNGLQFYRPL